MKVKIIGILTVLAMLLNMFSLSLADAGQDSSLVWLDPYGLCLSIRLRHSSFTLPPFRRGKLQRGGKAYCR